jgi:hypothetical protein
MGPAIESAARLGAVHPRPVVLADAGRGLEVVGPVLGASGQALVDLLVDLLAALALPTCLAVAFALDAGAVASAVRVRAVRCRDQEERREGGLVEASG